jgi:uncharacterized protein YktA (UPF0223 family)
MTEKKFTSKDLLRQLRPTPDLAYEFTNEEVLEGAKFFLFATRVEGGVTYKILGVVRHSMKEVVNGIAQLKKIKEELEEQGTIDYVIVIPPVQERHLIDYMMADDYKLYKDLRDNAFIVWICNPQEKSAWCCQGAPKDKRFNEYFKVKTSGGFMNTIANMPYRIESRELRKDLMKE